MGIRAWGKWSVLALASVAIAGCNCCGQRDSGIQSKGPPPIGQVQSQQKPGIANNNQTQNQNPFPLANSNNQQKPGNQSFIPTSGVGNQSNVKQAGGDPFQNLLNQNKQQNINPPPPPNPNSDLWKQPSTSNSLPANLNPIDLPPNPGFATQRENVRQTAPPSLPNTPVENPNIVRPNGFPGN